MLISLNEIKKYVKIPSDFTDDDLIKLIGSRLVEIEETIDLSKKYVGVYIVKVVKATPIEGTHLNLCEIDAGSHNSEFNQLDNGLVQVVCGAPNVHAGMLAVWITPGSIVPNTYGNENFKLSVRKLQGYESNGMLAGADELGLSDEHKTIAEINPNMAKPGDSFAEIFELNDIILDVENKSLTHRPDCFGLIGFAREVAGILGLDFEEPFWPEIAMVQDLPISVKIEDANLCPRYSCAVFDLPKHEKSRYLTYYGDVFLAKAGMRSIDPMVDLTNIIMLRTGQPLHAFDYDKLIAVGGTKSPKIIVRAATDGEEIQLLDGKTIKCIPEDILITSNNIPVALAGAMGGKNTEIDASTTRIVLESATFSLYNLRKTQMAHGIFSEAITRFTKGQPAAMTLPVLAETVAELGKSVTPLAVVDEWPAGEHKNVVKITTSAINNLLGTKYSVGEIVRTLENVGFMVNISTKSQLGSTDVSSQEGAELTSEHAVREPRNDGRERHVSEKKTAVESSGGNDAQNATLEVTVPVWRTDIHIPEDIIEEVGRLLGYDNIPLDLPKGAFYGTEIAPMFALKSKLRDLLSDRLGLHEVLTYSFISKNLLEKVGQDVAESYEIVNSISPDLQCFRQQITPSLLDKVRENIKSGHKSFTLYEMNQVTRRSFGLDQDGVPVSHTDLGIVSLSDFYALKSKIFAAIEDGLKLDLEYKRLAPGSDVAKQYPYLEPVRSAELFVGDRKIGAFGEVKASVRRKFKLDDQTISACELDLDQIVDLKPSIAVEVKMSKFPFVERDITFKVSADTPFGRIDECLHSVAQDPDLIFEIQPLSIYQPDSESKNFSFHLKFSNLNHTLDSAEISAIMEKITAAAAKLGAMTV